MDAFAKSTMTADDPANRSSASMAMTLADKPAALPPEPTGDDPKGLLFDPFALIDQLGYRDRPTGLTYQTLREMAKRVPTYTAILQTRLTQVKNFGQRQKDPREPGYGIILRDEKATPSRQDEKRMRQLEDWLMQTGTVWSHGRDNFKTFLTKITRDSLVLDQCCWEIQHNRKGEPWAFYAMDAGCMRLADVPPGAEANPPLDMVKYVQVYDEMVIAEYGPHQLCFGVRNPRTDIRVNGYGYSELEQLINVITSTLWAFEYNRKQFSQGTLARGLLNFKGTIPDKKIDAFRRQWKMMIAGIDNAHKTPMTNVDEVQWIDLHTDSQKMGYSDWMDWLIKITCAVMQFDPTEINFSYGNTGQSNQMFGTPVESKVQQSKDKGLKPLLEDLALWINTHLIWQLDPAMEFAFLGLSAKSTDQAVDLAKKQVTYLKTVDELRAEEDLEPLPDGTGEVILDPTWLQAKQAAEMAQQQEGEQPPDQDMGDVASLTGGGDEGEGEEDDGFSEMFAEEQPSEKSLKAFHSRRQQLVASRIRSPADLRKADKIPGGLAAGKGPKDFDQEALAAGIKVELEHTDDKEIAREIAMDHLTEDPRYYVKLRKIEKSGKARVKVYEIDL
jgi:hypothetical protein